MLNNATLYRRGLLTLLSFIPLFLSAQSTFTLNGYVEDAASKEKLISAIIYDVGSKQGVVTNNYGFYSLTLPRGAKTLSISFVGYETQELKFDLRKDSVINFQLKTGAEMKADRKSVV